MSEDLCQRIITRMTALNTRIEADPQLGAAFRIGRSFFAQPSVFLEKTSPHSSTSISRQVSQSLRAADGASNPTLSFSRRQKMS